MPATYCILAALAGLAALYLATRLKLRQIFPPDKPASANGLASGLALAMAALLVLLFVIHPDYPDDLEPNQHAKSICSPGSVDQLFAKNACRQDDQRGPLVR